MHLPLFCRTATYLLIYNHKCEKLVNKNNISFINLISLFNNGVILFIFCLLQYQRTIIYMRINLIIIDNSYKISNPKIYNKINTVKWVKENNTTINQIKTITTTIIKNSKMMMLRISKIVSMMSLMNNQHSILLPIRIIRKTSHHHRALDCLENLSQ